MINGDQYTLLDSESCCWMSRKYWQKCKPRIISIIYNEYTHITVYSFGECRVIILFSSFFCGSSRYDLNAEDVNKFLPMIDTSKTLIRNVCPSCLSRVACKTGKYRRADGLCNNMDNPTWGATMSTFNRLDYFPKALQLSYYHRFCFLFTASVLTKKPLLVFSD